MTIRLRAHHVLCMLTYVGKGYTPAFTVNYDAIVGRLRSGEAIRIGDGPDDICAPLLGDADPHCWRDSVIERDRQAAEALTNLLARAVRADTLLQLEQVELGKMRVAFAAGETRKACVDCEWSGLCTAIADADYRGIKLDKVSPQQA